MLGCLSENPTRHRTAGLGDATESVILLATVAAARRQSEVVALTRTAKLSNPYAAASTETGAQGSQTVRRGNLFGILLLAFPFVAAIPIWYFVHNHAVQLMRPVVGPDHRAGFLNIHFIGIIRIVGI